MSEKKWDKRQPNDRPAGQHPESRAISASSLAWLGWAGLGWGWAGLGWVWAELINLKMIFFLQI